MGTNGSLWLDPVQLHDALMSESATTHNHTACSDKREDRLTSGWRSRLLDPVLNHATLDWIGSPVLELYGKCSERVGAASDLGQVCCKRSTSEHLFNAFPEACLVSTQEGH